MKKAEYTIGFAAAIAVFILMAIRANLFTSQAAIGIMTIAVVAIAGLSAQLYYLSKKFNH